MQLQLSFKPNVRVLFCGEPGSTKELIILPHLETHDNNYGFLLLVGVL